MEKTFLTVLPQNASAFRCLILKRQQILGKRPKKKLPSVSSLLHAHLSTFRFSTFRVLGLDCKEIVMGESTVVSPPQHIAVKLETEKGEALC